MAEFALLNRYLSQLPKDDSVVLGVGDDAAVFQCPAGYQLVQTVDTMVDGVHFDAQFSAADLAYKLVHVNLSDIAAMGAVPRWATVALTLPQADETWLSAFATELRKTCQDNAVNLIGGDTTSGPLTVSLQMTGIVPENQYLTRFNAQIGDLVYVSGYLGDAALALSDKTNQLASSDRSYFDQRLLRPQAQLALGEQLRGLANSCIDVSDGLLADLGHICRQSGVGAELDVEKLPLSDSYKNVFNDAINYDFALNGGDDYQLCFTASKDKVEQIQKLETDTSSKISLIGRIVDATDTDNPISLTLNNTAYQCERVGWQHFAES